jgi:hypothetical protein
MTKRFLIVCWNLGIGYCLVMDAWSLVIFWGVLGVAIAL